MNKGKLYLVAVAAAVISFGLGYIAMNVAAKYVTSVDNAVTLTVRKPHYKVHFNANADASEISGEMPDQNFVYGVAQNLASNAFQRGNYKFIGWNTESDGSGQTYYLDAEEVDDLTSDDNGTVELFAQWYHYDYYHPDAKEFDGGTETGENSRTRFDDCEPTGIKLYNADNIAKDYEITFDIHPGYTWGNLMVMMNTMDEDNNKYPGIVFRNAGSGQSENNAIAGRSLNGNNKIFRSTGGLDKVTIRRVNKAITVFYNGEERQLSTDDSKSDNVHNIPVTFGCAMKGGSYFRPFTGTLSNMTVRVMNNGTYIVTFDKNNGNGTMTSQAIESGVATALDKNEFTKSGFIFKEWNTAADGSGTSYRDKDVVKDMGATGDNVILYAIWEVE